MEIEENSLGSNEFTSKGASTLFDTLKECNSVISKLYISQNQLDDDCIKPLDEFIQSNEHIDTIDLSNNSISDKGVEILSDYLIGNITLKHIELNGNEITDASIPNLLEIAKKSYITKMFLWRMPISNQKKQELDKALKISIDQREIPIKSNSKSAAKIQS